MTCDQIQSVLRQEYDQQRWLNALREIMPGTDVFAAPQVVPVNIPDAPPPVQIARVRLGDRKQLAVLEIKVSDRIDLLRNRVGLRNLVARFIDQAEYHGVLAVFRSPQKDYRFTFAAKISDLDQEGNLLRNCLKNGMLEFRTDSALPKQRKAEENLDLRLPKKPFHF